LISFWSQGILGVNLEYNNQTGIWDFIEWSCGAIIWAISKCSSSIFKSLK
jgi:hypothetical protein